MKKLLFLLLFNLIFLSLEAQLDFYVVDSLYCYSHNGATTTPTERQYNISFSPTGEALESRREKYLPWLGQWRNLAHLTYVYDNQGNLVQQVEQSWDTLALDWVNATITENTPNPNGDFTQTVNSVWDGQNWQFSEMVNSTFGANGFIETLTQQLWENGNWRNNLRILYATNAVGKFVQTKFQLWNTTSNSFYDVNRQTYFYDSQNPDLEVEQLTEVFDQTLMQWDSSSQLLKMYDSQGNLTEQTTQTWNTIDSNWVNSGRILQNYNAENNLTLRTELVWNGNQWVNFFQVNNVYDTNQNLIRFEVSFWDVTFWNLLSSCDFYPRFHHVISAANEPRLEICQLPNPYRLGQPIDCAEMLSTGAKRLEIFDFSGKMISSQNIENQSVIAINGDFPTGMYVAKISGERGKFFTQKLLIFSGK
ncbi:MAG: T9SS type A sorting domain-containing protein [Saprospiraceae bacterium]|nr:T9SS type A sorting domain-containing protein [Saprospiraceae bacterium]MCF8250605.1 T9SS type A sorting domain-containing protein [Saprospiraceae bacterium]MCF8281422.1 T9SS type A sorting domain-containing protein [Bacteroidales bacterium]MCF8313075.1 T9SS type A sorting domain-containing protein [Saprospiraceae bacterium]MCF8441560.1 T9SS type A sorting domain-containing protein [Saprospiraceae bacterium]